MPTEHECGELKAENMLLKQSLETLTANIATINAHIMQLNQQIQRLTYIIIGISVFFGRDEVINMIK